MPPTIGIQSVSFICLFLHLTEIGKTMRHLELDRTDATAVRQAEQATVPRTSIATLNSIYEVGFLPRNTLTQLGGAVLTTNIIQ